jgi:hypothetical protein
MNADITRISHDEQTGIISMPVMPLVTGLSPLQPAIRFLADVTD